MKPDSSGGGPGPEALEERGIVERQEAPGGLDAQRSLGKDEPFTPSASGTSQQCQERYSRRSREAPPADWGESLSRFGEKAMRPPTRALPHPRGIEPAKTLGDGLLAARRWCAPSRGRRRDGSHSMNESSAPPRPPAANHLPRAYGRSSLHSERVGRRDFYGGRRQRGPDPSPRAARRADPRRGRGRVVDGHDRGMKIMGKAQALRTNKPHGVKIRSRRRACPTAGQIKRAINFS